MSLRPERAEQIKDFEIACARLYVQDRLATPTIADRLGTTAAVVLATLKRVGIPITQRSKEWLW